MASSQPRKVSIKTTGDLIASVPYLLGFHPENSLILVLRSDKMIICVVRTDLPSPQWYPGLVDQLRDTVHANNADDVDVIVIDHSGSTTGRPPHADLVEAVRAAMPGVIRVRAWAQTASFAAQWRCYGPCDCSGLVSNLGDAQLAGYGGRVFATRGEMAAGLQLQCDAATSKRRAALARRIVREQRDRASSVEKLEAAINRAKHGELPVEDEHIVELAVALADVIVRDACIMQLDTPAAEGAEALWTVLTREAPPGFRASPACLLAIFACCRGEGALAQVALSEVATDDPENKLAELLKTAMDMGVRPAMITQLLRGAMDVGEAP